MQVCKIFKPHGLSNPTLEVEQCWKFLLPGRPRLPVLGLGDLLPEAGSPGGQPKNPYLSFYGPYRTL